MCLSDSGSDVSHTQYISHDMCRACDILTLYILHMCYLCYLPQSVTLILAAATILFGLHSIYLHCDCLSYYFWHTVVLLFATSCSLFRLPLGIIKLLSNLNTGPGRIATQCRQLVLVYVKSGFFFFSTPWVLDVGRKCSRL